MSRCMSRREKANREVNGAGRGSVSAPRTGLWLRRRRQSSRSLCTWPWGRRCAPGWRPWHTPRRCCCGRRAWHGTIQSRIPSPQTAPPWRQSPWRTTCMKEGGRAGGRAGGRNEGGEIRVGLVELTCKLGIPTCPVTAPAGQPGQARQAGLGLAANCTALTCSC